MKQLLSKLESLLNRAGYRTNYFLSEGLDEDKIRLDASFLPEEAVQLFCWRNGMRTESRLETLGRSWFFSFGYLLSFEECNDLFKTKSYLGYSSKFTPTMFPLFASGGGELYFVECDPKLLSFRQIFYFTLAEVEVDELVSKYDSLTHFIDMVNECYETGTYFFDEERNFCCKYEEEIEIGLKINTRSEYWKALSQV